MGLPLRERSEKSFALCKANTCSPEPRVASLAPAKSGLLCGVWLFSVCLSLWLGVRSGLPFALGI